MEIVHSAWKTSLLAFFCYKGFNFVWHPEAPLPYILLKIWDSDQFMKWWIKQIRSFKLLIWIWFFTLLIWHLQSDSFNQNSPLRATEKELPLLIWKISIFWGNSVVQKYFRDTVESVLMSVQHGDSQRETKHKFCEGNTRTEIRWMIFSANLGLQDSVILSQCVWLWGSIEET